MYWFKENILTHNAAIVKNRQITLKENAPIKTATTVCNLKLIKRTKTPGNFQSEVLVYLLTKDVR